MAVYRRSSKGIKSKNYYCNYSLPNGTRKIKCTGKSLRKEAEEWERENIEKLKSLKTDKAVVQEYRAVLRGCSSVKLEDAFSIFNSKIKKKAGPTYIRKLQSHWNDFVHFLKAKYTHATKMCDVTSEMASSYYNQLVDSGRFLKETSYKRNGKKIVSPLRIHNLSNRQVNSFLTFLKQIFSALAVEAGIFENPFDKIEKLPLKTEHREPFTATELGRIGEESQKNDPFLYPLFLIAVYTGLREGDCCTLKWSEIDFQDRWINRTMNKTGNTVRIPILDPLWDYIKTLTHNGSEFILTDQSQMYLKNPSGISVRVKNFFEKIGIATTKKVDGRDRAISIRDFHSLRHTFCYVAAKAQIPFPTVKSVMGHMDSRMTQMYMDHASDVDKKKHLARLPNYLNPKLPLRTLKTPIEKLAEIEEIIKDQKESNLKRSLLSILNN